MGKKYLTLTAIILAAELFAALPCMGKAPKQAKAGYGVCDVAIECLENKKKSYDSQAYELNREIARLQEKQDAEAEMDQLVIYFIEAQNMSALAGKQIQDYLKKKDQIELAGSEPDYVEYRISAHDELQINVYGEPDLTKTVRVAADGTISYPLIGKVNVDGLTTQGLEEKLSKLLIDGGYIVNPQVSVYVERFSSVSILGEVRNPGSYELKGRLSIMDAIAQADGFNIDADINNVKILRIEDGQQKTINIKLGDIKKGMEGVEIILKPNDTIFVEKIGKATVLGEVTRPGTFELKDRITVLEAIAMAGGFTDIAAINGMRIIRENPGSKKKVIRINVTDVISRGKKEKDIDLVPGDIVYVPESLF